MCHHPIAITLAQSFIVVYANSMNQSTQTAISPTRAQNYPEWYQQVVKAADLAELSPVRGCMVIKPWGYGIWENIQKILDARFKELGHENAYFPLLIPKSFLEKEAQHVDGFAKECAVVTHHRLKQGADGNLVPDGELEEPLVVRPTSETIIGAMFSKWVQSYRDLPILINQWANIVRWEMRTRLFLRTTEFLWQEGHTVHATADEAIAETLQMLAVYEDFAKSYLAIPVFAGEKVASERFPGAVQTFSIEAMMQDGKALQAGTSHFLGQNFAKAQEIRYLNESGQQVHAWTTSWGVSTRLIGGIIMTHSDDDGLVLPPKIAPKQVVILPIYRDDAERASVMAFCEALSKEISAEVFSGEKISVYIDKRDLRGGEKTWQAIKKGVPVRVEIGPRDVAANSVFVGRRDFGPKEKKSVPRSEFVKTLPSVLQEIQDRLYERALAYCKNQTREFLDFKQIVDFYTSEDSSGFGVCFLTDSPIVDEKLKEFKLSVRCIPNETKDMTGKCLITGQPGARRVIIAKAY